MKPALHEIANMPHSQAVMAMREHYDPQWPMVTADPDELVECELCGDEVPRGKVVFDALDGEICQQCCAAILDAEDEA